MSANSTHWRETDFRAPSLNKIIHGLDSALINLKLRHEQCDWYDAGFLYEDSEPIIGMTYIAFQNYINGTIKDFFEATKENEKLKYYRIQSGYNKFERSYIELIIALANYSKHKDFEIQSNTKLVLESFDLKVDSDFDIFQSPIINGLKILDPDFNILSVKKNIYQWRQDVHDLLVDQFK